MGVNLHKLGIILAVAFLFGAVSSAEGKNDRTTVSVPLMIEEAPAQTSTLKLGEAPPIRRLRAVKSAKLLQDVDAENGFGMKNLQMNKGATLLLAKGEEGREFFCGPYQPKRGGKFIAGNAWNLWICFEDTDKDGIFDRGAFSDHNGMKVLPSFVSISGIHPLSAPYTLDPESETAAYGFGVSYVSADATTVKLRTYVTPFDSAAGESFGVSQGDLKNGEVTVSTSMLPQSKNLVLRDILISARSGDELSVTLQPAPASMGGFGLRLR